jgi:hypothetical protein
MKPRVSCGASPGWPFGEEIDNEPLKIAEMPEPSRFRAFFEAKKPGIPKIEGTFVPPFKGGFLCLPYSKK